MKKDIKVFVSSTCYDLIDVRAELEAVLVEAGLLPVLSDRPSSEFTSQTDENSIETCLTNLRACDIVIVVLNQRYGPSLAPLDLDVSATHLEYQEAVKANIPIRMYVRDRLAADYEIWRKNKTRAGLQFSWIHSEQDHPLFALIDEHKRLSREKKASNWFWTFQDSRDLSQRVMRDFNCHSQQAKLKKTLVAGELSRHLCDIFEGVAQGRAGLALSIENEDELGVWRHNVLGMLHQLFVSRQPDISVTWLRPFGGASPRLRLFDHINLSKEAHHYEFRFDEGFAGKCWSHGRAQYTSSAHQHEWWTYRQGCENTTYACAPIGTSSSNGGVLAIGSDTGFEITDVDLEILCMFGACLAISCIERDVKFV